MHLPLICYGTILGHIVMDVCAHKVSSIYSSLDLESLNSGLNDTADVAELRRYVLPIDSHQQVRLYYILIHYFLKGVKQSKTLVRRAPEFVFFHTSNIPNGNVL